MKLCLYNFLVESYKFLCLELCGKDVSFAGTVSLVRNIFWRQKRHKQLFRSVSFFTANKTRNFAQCLSVNYSRYCYYSFAHKLVLNALMLVMPMESVVNMICVSVIEIGWEKIVRRVSSLDVISFAFLDNHFQRDVSIWISICGQPER